MVCRRTLARLLGCNECDLRTALPQGSKTSPLLANIVFWKEEPILVEELHSEGIFYTRLVDDITCSANRDLNSKEITRSIQRLHSMGRRLGFGGCYESAMAAHENRGNC